MSLWLVLPFYLRISTAAAELQFEPVAVAPSPSPAPSAEIPTAPAEPVEVGVNSGGSAPRGDCANCATPKVNPGAPVGEGLVTANLLAVLNLAAHDSKEYAAAVQAWPIEVPIWPQLTSREAREQFVRHLLLLDDTNKREYQAFDNLCTGFSAQLYARLSSRSKLTALDLERLKKAKVEGPPFAAKLRVPMFTATYPGHAFNAVLMDETRPDEASAYLIIEPQLDEIYKPGSSQYQKYVLTNGIAFDDLESFNENGQYKSRPHREYQFDATGVPHLIAKRQVSYVITNFRVGSSHPMNYDYYVGKKSFEDYIRQRMGMFDLSEDDVVQIGKVLVGSKFKRAPDASDETMTLDEFIRLVGDPKFPRLRQRLERPAAQP